MARPKKLVGKKTAHIDVRLSADEKQIVIQAANEAGLYTADFVRHKLLSSSPRTRKATPEREAFLKGMAELGKIGSNINQIAKSLNAHKDEPIAKVVSGDLISTSLHGIETLSRHILNVLQGGN